MKDQARLAAAATLSWLASKVAPSSMRGVFLTYNKMLKVFPDELARGRTYGVVSVAWSMGDGDADKADDMLSDCIIAAARARERHDMEEERAAA